MPRTCAVVGCSKRGDRDVENWFRFPLVDKRTEKRNELSKKRQIAWLNALKRADMVPEKWPSTVVCSQHFISGRSADLMDEKNPDWVPSQKLGYAVGVATRVTPAAAGRFDRVIKRNDKKKAEEKALELMAVEESLSVPEPVDRVTVLENEVEKLKRETELVKLRNQPLICTSLEDFWPTDEKCRYFTGLNHKTFKLVYEFLEPYLPASGGSKFQMLLITLTKFRLDLDLTLISYMSGLHISTVSRYYQKCIYVMFQRLKGLVRWPSREAVQNSMPACFKKHFENKVSIIIDCFEVLTEKPGDVMQAAQMWSNYKHSHTVKYLIGIAPNGTIIFISNAYGGRASDKYITEKSGLLGNMQQGDCVMADRGFLIRDAVEEVGAELLLPAFTVGLDQLHPLDIEKTRKLANVRIHVERVIAQLRTKYRILYKNKFPITTLKKSSNFSDTSFIDQIVTVCCSLVNLCSSVVPQD